MKYVKFLTVAVALSATTCFAQDKAATKAEAPKKSHSAKKAAKVEKEIIVDQNTGEVIGEREVPKEKPTKAKAAAAKADKADKGAKK